MYKYTQIDEQKKGKMVRWLSRQNNEIMYEVFKEQKQQFYRLKNLYQNEDLTLLSTASFIRAIHDIYSKISKKSQKAEEGNLRKIRSSTKLKAKQIKKQTQHPKLDKLFLLQDIIKTFRQEGISYYKISDYLKSQHKFTVSHTTIRNFYIKNLEPNLSLSRTSEERIKF
ncbi:hypothetical protein [Sulfurimonas sp.]